MTDLIKIKNIVKLFPLTGGFFGKSAGAVHAVNGVSLDIKKGETLGLVGESGSGKSTLGMLILRLIDADEGNIIFDGQDITKMNQKEMRKLRKQMQVIFQDPYASLNPRMTVGEIVEEPLLVHKIGNKKERMDRVRELISLVGLAKDAQGKYPHEFSGGQRQRVGIARAIALNPRFIIADEPVSALDVSIRGEIINLMNDLQAKFGLTYLFISHDLTIVAHTSSRIAVMYLGRLMESFPSTMMNAVLHPYTQALLSAVPIPDPTLKKKRIILSGDIPSPLKLPGGCVFNTRCKYANERCREEMPLFKEYADNCVAACHYINEMKPLGSSTHG